MTDRGSEPREVWPPEHMAGEIERDRGLVRLEIVELHHHARAVEDIRTPQRRRGRTPPHRAQRVIGESLRECRAARDSRADGAPVQVRGRRIHAEERIGNATAHVERLPGRDGAVHEDLEHLVSTDRMRPGEQGARGHGVGELAPGSRLRRPGKSETQRSGTCQRPCKESTSRNAHETSRVFPLRVSPQYAPRTPAATEMKCRRMQGLRLCTAFDRPRVAARPKVV